MPLELAASTNQISHTGHMCWKSITMFAALDKAQCGFTQADDVYNVNPRIPQFITNVAAEMGP